MSNMLLVFIGPDQAFDVDAIDDAIASVAGWKVDRLGPGIGAVQQYTCSRDGHQLLVRISADTETVTISGHFGLPSAAFAMAIQQALGGPLRITDMDYNFDLELGGYSTPQDLLAAANSVA